MDISFNRFRKQLGEWKDKFKKKDTVYRTFTPAKGRPMSVLASNEDFVIPKTIEDVLSPRNRDHAFMNIYEINLLHIGYCKGFNEDPELVWGILKRLYKEVLYEDPFWHFFYEGEYSIVRCSGELTEKVCNFLDGHDIVYMEPNMWLDSSPTVRKFHAVFTTLFHSYSVLAMEYNDEEWFVTADRVIHCYMNHQWYRQWAQWFRKCWGEDYWEGMALSEHALRRTGYQNWSRGMLEERARAEKKEQE